jgi:hypothetical protein
MRKFVYPYRNGEKKLKLCIHLYFSKVNFKKCEYKHIVYVSKTDQIPSFVLNFLKFD